MPKIAPDAGNGSRPEAVVDFAAVRPTAALSEHSGRPSTIGGFWLLDAQRALADDIRWGSSG